MGAEVGDGRGCRALGGALQREECQERSYGMAMPLSTMVVTSTSDFGMMSTV
jgi:hypothetical protein